MNSHVPTPKELYELGLYRKAAKPEELKIYEYLGKIRRFEMVHPSNLEKMIEEVVELLEFIAERVPDVTSVQEMKAIQNDDAWLGGADTQIWALQRKIQALESKLSVAKSMCDGAEKKYRGLKNVYDRWTRKIQDEHDLIVDVLVDE